MSILKYFKNIPRSPPIGRQALSVIFFLQIRNEVPSKKKGPCRPPQGRQGPVTRWGATGSPLPYTSPGRHMPPSPLSFEPKNSGKKRGVRIRKAAKLCRIPHCDLSVTSV